MTLILHIGTTKTGTNAIQANCRRLADALRAHGVEYVNRDRRQRLVTRFWRLSPEEQHVSDDAFGRARAARDDPAMRAVLVSAELMLKMPPERRSEMITRLGFSPAEAIVVCYVRRPSSFWLSSTQQELKKWSAVTPAHARYRFRADIEDWTGLVGRDAMRVRPYAAPSAGAGAFADFVRGVLEPLCPGVARLADPCDPGASALHNVSLTQEGMALWWRLRATCFLEVEGRHTAVSRLMLDELLDVSAEGGTRPRLLPHIARWIDAAHADDLDWLAETHGVDFDLPPADPAERAHARRALADPGLDLERMMPATDPHEVAALAERLAERLRAVQRGERPPARRGTPAEVPAALAALGRVIAADAWSIGHR